MREAGVDISHHTSKSVDDILKSGRSFDYVIAVCDKEAAERCPVLPGSGMKLHWSFADPSKAQGTDEEKARFAATVREQIKVKLQEWIASSL